MYFLYHVMVRRKMCELIQMFINNNNKKIQVLLRSNKHFYPCGIRVKQALLANCFCPSFLHIDLVSTFFWLCLVYESISLAHISNSSLLVAF